MLLLNLGRRALLIIACISFFVSCVHPQPHRITLWHLAKLRQGMTVEESQKVTNKSPKHTFFLDGLEGNDTIEVHAYILFSGAYGSNYFLVYRNKRLIYWGYPHEFARSKDPVLNEIGRKAASVSLL